MTCGVSPAVAAASTAVGPGDEVPAAVVAAAATANLEKV
jgi:hypothetical protein